MQQAAGPGMEEFDHNAWIARTRAFALSLQGRDDTEARFIALAPPATEGDIADVERVLGATIPLSLRDFFTRGSAHVDWVYTLNPKGGAQDRLHIVLPDVNRIFGGARVGPAFELHDFVRSVRQWATDTWVADEPAQRGIWESALPFARLDNGDYLAVDGRRHETDAPILYLNHDDESFVIAPHFVAFLEAWEQLCYIGPEHWLLGSFTAPGGYLDPTSERAEQLRRLFVRS